MYNAFKNYTGFSRMKLEMRFEIANAFKTDCRSKSHYLDSRTGVLRVKELCISVVTHGLHVKGKHGQLL